ncbi:MAG: hypothetical protein HZB16_18540, partial [Armatimonadetes bacterium]|nr:hypothetical protein [Armatimonadota bacterium]
LDLTLAAAYLYAARRMERSSATALAVLALLPLALVPVGLAGPSVDWVHQPLLGGSYPLALVLLGAWWRRSAWLPGAQAALGLAAASALLTLSASVQWSPADDTFALLCGYAVLAAPFAPLAGLWLGQAAALWGLLVMWPPEEPWRPMLGLRLGFIVLADAVVAAAGRAKPEWRRAWLTPAALLALVSLPLLFQPPARPSVLGLLVLAVAAVTAAWLVERRELNDAGFACAWLAGIMVLYDTARHGQGELLPYRSLDLYLAPMAIYTLAISERRSASPAGLRLMAVVMLLGSLLVSALAGASWLHSAALFVAVAGAVAYGVLRADLAIRFAGLAAFAAWFLVFLWRQQENSRWLLIPLLVLLGMGAMWLAVNQERRQRQ